jgi:hypothetical protein
MENLIAEIERYCTQRKMGLGTFGSYAVRDGKFVERLKRGGQCLPSTEAKVRAFMADNPPENPPDTDHEAPERLQVSP